MELLVDTCFLIDYQRRRQVAVDWLTANPKNSFVLCSVVYGEFAVGASNLAKIHDLFAEARRLSVGFGTAAAYAEIVRNLRSQGRMIGGNDLWIAALALEHGLPILTRNLREFERVPGLRIESY